MVNSEGFVELKLSTVIIELPSNSFGGVKPSNLKSFISCCGNGYIIYKPLWTTLLP